MEIIQGSNQSIILNVGKEASSITKLSCFLYSQNEDLKKWDKDSVTFDEGKIILPLTESETMAFSKGATTLEVKWLEDGNIEFAKKIKINIVERRDTTKLTESANE